MSNTNYQEDGFVIIKNAIPNDYCAEALKIGNSIYPEHMAKFAEPKAFGSTHHWKTMDMYSSVYPELFSLMTSDFMKEIVLEYLGPDAFLFNDQFVIKQANENYEFPWHYDNFYTSDPSGEFEGRYRAITTAWFLTPNNSNCGGLRFLPLSKTKKYDYKKLIPPSEFVVPIDAEAGDLGIWTGTTLHSSPGNLSDSQRSVWLQVYSTIPLGTAWKNGYYDKQFLKEGSKIL